MPYEIARETAITISVAQEADMPTVLAFRSSDHRWEDCTDDSIFLVARLDDEIVGFTFCKQLSPQWAMLDSMYVAPEHRAAGVGRLLYDELLSRIRQRRIEYVSALIDVSDTATQAVAQSHGFTPKKTYIWHDMMIEPAS